MCNVYTTICSSQKRIFHIYPNPFLWKSFPLFLPVNIHTNFAVGQTMTTEQKMLSSGSVFVRRKQRREYVMKNNNQINVPLIS